MRAIDCPCGHHFEAADDEELFRLCREHVNAEHPEMQRPATSRSSSGSRPTPTVETIA
jgi:hypothetical protein